MNNSMEQTARSFFEACEGGEGWQVCSRYCKPDASFAAQAEALADVTTLEAYTDWMKGLYTLMPDAGYGWVCDVATLKRFGSLSVSTVHQEHGTVPVPDESWFARLPIGSRVRILPNHACLTCAAYSSYDVLRAGPPPSTTHLIEQWPRVGGW